MGGYDGRHNAYQKSAAALDWLRKNVFEQAHKQAQTNELIWLGLGAVALYLFAKGNAGSGA